MFAVYASGKCSGASALPSVDRHVHWGTTAAWEKIEMTLTRKRKIAARRTNERDLYIRKIVPVVRLGGLASARPIRKVKKQQTNRLHCMAEGTRPSDAARGMFSLCVGQ